MYICFCLPKDYKIVRDIINNDLLLRNTTKQIIVTPYCDNDYAYFVEVHNERTL